MSEDEPLDPALSQCFESSPGALPEQPFVEQVHRRVQRARRWQLLRRVALRVLLALIVAWLGTRYAALGSLALTDAALRVLSASGTLASSPAAWAASLALALWIGWRRRALR
jgi:hypothetical protein